MKKQVSQRLRRRIPYRVLLMSCMAASLLVVIAMVRLWPSSAPKEASPPPIYDEEAIAIEIEEVLQTKQALRKAPPPPPLPPVEEAEVLEKQPLDFSVELAPVPSPEEAPPGPQTRTDGPAEASSAKAPEVGARLLRTPEPSYTKAARQQGVIARVEVEVVIAPTGRVTKATILRRLLLSDQGRPMRTVATLGYGLEESALEAARQSLFRPARVGEQPVKSRKKITLTFGL